MTKIKVRAYTLMEAEEIMKFCLRQGYEGVQNDSYRYCKESAYRCIEKGTCFICVYNGGFGNIIVCDTHWHEHRQYKELSKSKFKEVLIPYSYKKASNPIIATDKDIAEEIIIHLKRVEEDYRIDLTREIEWLRNKVKG